MIGGVEIFKYFKRNWKDLITILSVPTLLWFLFFLPANVKESMILHKEYQNGCDLFLSHYVHETYDHIIPNVLFYLVFSFLLYSCLSKLGKEKLFRLIFVVNCIALPFILSFIWIPVNKYFFTTAQRTCGFSGIVAAFMGSFVFSYILFLKVKLNIDEFYAYLSSIILIAFMFTVIYFNVSSTEVIIVLIIVLCITFAIFLWSTYKFIKSIKEEAKLRLIRLSKKRWLVEILPFFHYLLIIALSFALFPRDTSRDSSAINFVMHYFGFILGICVAYQIYAWMERRQKL